MGTEEEEEEEEEFFNHYKNDLERHEVGYPLNLLQCSNQGPQARADTY